MKKTSFKEIKLRARVSMKGHFGEAFLALLVVPFVFSFGNSIIGMTFMNQIVISYIFQFFYSILISYITIIMALKFAKGDYANLFKKLFGTKEGYLNMVIFTAAITLITLLPLLLYYDFVMSLFDYITTIPANYYPTPDELHNQMINFLPSTALLITSGILLIIAGIVSLKFIFVRYLIIDKKMKAFEAMKLSWQYTNGNFFRIIFFSLSFILWYLLIFLTCGLILIYLIPYLILSYTMFYRAVLREHGEEVEEKFVDKDEISKEGLFKTDPLADDNDDPFDAL